MVEIFLIKVVIKDPLLTSHVLLTCKVAYSSKIDKLSVVEVKKRYVDVCRKISTPFWLKNECPEIIFERAKPFISVFFDDGEKKWLV